MTPPLWTRRALGGMTLSSLAGLGLIAAAFNGAQSESSLAAQVTWLNVGVLGTVIAGTAQAGLLITGRRLVTVCRQEVLATLPSAAAGMPGPVTATGRVIDNAADGRVIVPDGTWHHDRTCQLVAGKGWEVAPADSATTACPLCEAV